MKEKINLTQPTEKELELANKIMTSEEKALSRSREEGYEAASREIKNRSKLRIDMSTGKEIVDPIDWTKEKLKIDTAYFGRHLGESIFKETVTPDQFNTTLNPDLQREVDDYNERSSHERSSSLYEIEVTKQCSITKTDGGYAISFKQKEYDPRFNFNPPPFDVVIQCDDTGKVVDAYGVDSGYMFSQRGNIFSSVDTRKKIALTREEVIESMKSLRRSMDRVDNKENDTDVTKLLKDRKNIKEQIGGTSVLMSWNETDETYKLWIPDARHVSMPHLTIPIDDIDYARSVVQKLNTTTIKDDPYALYEEIRNYISELFKSPDQINVIPYMESGPIDGERTVIKNIAIDYGKMDPEANEWELYIDFSKVDNTPAIALSTKSKEEAHQLFTKAKQLINSKISNETLKNSLQEFIDEQKPEEVL